MAAESAILTQIRLALAQHLKKDPGRVLPEHTLRDDLGLDSLSTLELLFKLEEAFDMEIPNEDLPRLSTVQSVATYIEERIAAGDGHVPAAPGALAALASQAVVAAGPRTAAPAASKAAAAPPPRPTPAPKAQTARRASAKPAPVARQATPAKATPAKATSAKAAAKGGRPVSKARRRP
jgi:acyl carrier protein